MKTLLFKALVLIAILVETLFFGLLPIFFIKKLDKRSSFRDRAISLANSFSGGIFLSTAFIHLLAEASEELSANVKTDKPIALILCGFGFLSVFFIERILLGSFKHQHHDDNNRNQPAITNSFRDYNSQALLDRSDYNDDEEIEPLQMHHNKSQPSAGIGSQLLVFVMSIHSFTAAVALGLQNSNNDVLPIFIAIIAHKWVESFAVGVSLVKANTKRKKAIFLMLMYASMVFIGITVGSLLVEYVIDDTRTSDIVEACSSAVASGIFIYVATMDVLAEEFAHNDHSDNNNNNSINNDSDYDNNEAERQQTHKSGGTKLRYLKFLFLLIGFLMMTGLLLVIPE